MQDARYLRSQAELCLQMARKLNDDNLAKNLGSAAAQYFQRAVESERPQVIGEPDPSTA